MRTPLFLFASILAFAPAPPVHAADSCESLLSQIRTEARRSARVTKRIATEQARLEALRERQAERRKKLESAEGELDAKSEIDARIRNARRMTSSRHNHLDVIIETKSLVIEQFLAEGDRSAVVNLVQDLFTEYAQLTRKGALIETELGELQARRAELQGAKDRDSLDTLTAEIEQDIQTKTLELEQVLQDRGQLHAEYRTYRLLLHRKAFRSGQFTEAELKDFETVYGASKIEFAENMEAIKDEARRQKLLKILARCTARKVLYRLGVLGWEFSSFLYDTKESEPYTREVANSNELIAGERSLKAANGVPAQEPRALGQDEGLESVPSAEATEVRALAETLRDPQRDEVRRFGAKPDSPDDLTPADLRPPTLTETIEAYRKYRPLQEGYRDRYLREQRSYAIRANFISIVGNVLRGVVKVIPFPHKVKVILMKLIVYFYNQEARDTHFEKINDILLNPRGFDLQFAQFNRGFANDPRLVYSLARREGSEKFYEAVVAKAESDPKKYKRLLKHIERANREAEKFGPIPLEAESLLVAVWGSIKELIAIGAFALATDAVKDQVVLPVVDTLAFAVKRVFHDGMTLEEAERIVNEMREKIDLNSLPAPAPDAPNAPDAPQENPGPGHK
jgi:hypothetical protein